MKAGAPGCILRCARVALGKEAPPGKEPYTTPPSPTPTPTHSEGGEGAASSPLHIRSQLSIRAIYSGERPGLFRLLGFGLVAESGCFLDCCLVRGVVIGGIASVWAGLRFQ